MKLRIKRFLLVCLIIVGIVLNACSGQLNQSINLTPSLTLSSSTSTITVTPTLNLIDELNVLLTTSPTRYPLPTLPPNCGTVKLGSAGSQTIDNTQKILVQGIAILCGQIYFPIIGSHETIKVLEGMIDLDIGAFSTNNADIQFCPGGGSMIWYWFCNLNDSYIMQYSINGLTMEPAKEPTFEDCQSITKHLSMDYGNATDFACVITNLGNISRMKVEQSDPLNDVMSVQISFITWEK